MTTEMQSERSVFDAADEFAMNPEPRVALALILDQSGSMGQPVGEVVPIDEENTGLRALKAALMDDDLTRKRVEVATFTIPPGGETTFATAQDWEPPALAAAGATPLGNAVERAVAGIRARKDAYQKAGIQYYRPWIWLVTDAESQGMDDTTTAARLIRAGDNEEAKAFCFFAVGTENADFDLLRRISVREPLRLRQTAWREMFLYVANSLKAVSRSKPSEAVPLADPTVGPSGWATTASPKAA